MFKLLVLKEFQEFKALKSLHTQWDVAQYLSRANAQPPIERVPEEERLTSVKEVDLLYYAMFGCTPEEWAAQNPKLVSKGLHLHDVLSLEQRIVYAQLAKRNQEIKDRDGRDLKKGLRSLREDALSQLQSLRNSPAWNQDKKSVSPTEEENDFDKYLEALLALPPMKK